jgi:hypothetical protein
MSARYRIPDEPLPTGLAHLAVDPLWPMLAQMLAGSWLALPWFALNAQALGSPTRVREWLLAAGSLLAGVALVLGFAAAERQGALPAAWVPFAVLVMVCAKLAFAYALYMHQARVFELWEYFGGKARNGLVVLLLAALFGRAWVLTQVGNGLAQLVLS